MGHIMAGAMGVLTTVAPDIMGVVTEAGIMVMEGMVTMGDTVDMADMGTMVMGAAVKKRRFECE